MSNAEEMQDQIRDDEQDLIKPSAATITRLDHESLLFAPTASVQSAPPASQVEDPPLTREITAEELGKAILQVIRPATSIIPPPGLSLPNAAPAPKYARNPFWGKNQNYRDTAIAPVNAVAVIAAQAPQGDAAVQCGSGNGVPRSPHAELRATFELRTRIMVFQTNQVRVRHWLSVSRPPLSDCTCGEPLATSK
ncbi:hypothetical protein U1Q18_048394 [Sarracenia purpurea var. burkii]